MRETAVLLRQGALLVGVLSEPPAFYAGADVPAVILLNAGTVHRVGLNRLHVRMARDLAAAGFPVVRFDFSGMGDSPSRVDDMPFHTSSVCEVQQVMDYLGARNCRRFVLAGLCSGANVAFRTAGRDPRVAALIGINGTYLEEDEWRTVAERVQRRIRGRYYWKHVLDVGKWWRFLRGKSDLRKIAGLVLGPGTALHRRHPPRGPRNDRPDSWDVLTRRGVDALLVYSEGSATLDAYSLAVKSRVEKAEPGRVTVQVIPDCDHACTLRWSQQALLDLIHTWMVSENRSWKTGDPGTGQVETH